MPTLYDKSNSINEGLGSPLIAQLDKQSMHTCNNFPKHEGFLFLSKEAIICMVFLSSNVYQGVSERIY